MKNFFIPFLLLPLAIACQSIKSEAASAAEEYYLKYADRKDLTVALVSGYEKEGTTLNVVKLQAHDKQTFKQLLADFDVKTEPVGDKQKPVADDASKTRTTTLTKNESFVIVNGDTLANAPVLSSFSDFGSYVDSVMRTIAVDENGRLKVTKDTVYDSVMTVRHRKTYDHGVLVSESSDTTADADFLNERRGALMKTASTYGNRGFGTLSDDENLTLWLLFYNSMEEFGAILDNILKANS